MSFKTKRWLIIGGTVVFMLIIAGVVAFQFAVRSLRAEIADVLGPESEISELKVGLTSVVITDVLIKAPRGWPADSQLRAERVTAMPDWRQLLSRRVYV